MFLLSLLCAVLLDTTMKKHKQRRLKEWHKNDKGKRMLLYIWKLTPDRQGLKVDVSITRKNIRGENILAANPRKLEKKFTLRTENKLTKLSPPIQYCSKRREGKEETV